VTFRGASIASLPAVLGSILLVGCYADDGRSNDASTDPQQGDAYPAGDAASDVPSESTPEPAPDFTLTDLNPASPTYEQDRSVSDMVGKVLLIYFANYS